MKYIKLFNELNEALLPSQFRKYMKKFNRERYEEVFQSLKNKYSGDRNAYRIYVPILKTDTVSEIQLEIVDFLDKNGVDVLDYKKGECKKRGSNNVTKIGKVLTQLKNDSLMNKFVADPVRKSQKDEYLVCISRHPYDIAGADTDRHWTNCMTLKSSNNPKTKQLIKQYNELKKTDPKNPELEDLEDEIIDRKVSGQNSHYLIHDVKEGSLIAYLIKSTDLNINDPIANWNIKPFVNEEDKTDVILVKDAKGYGNINKDFENTIQSILDEINGEKEGYLYIINDKIYDDGKSHMYNITEKTKLLLAKKLGLTFNKKTNKWDSNGDVHLSYMGLKKLPFNFGYIKGYFYCYNNQLTSLEGSPDKTKNDFNCSNNQLTSLEGGPSIVGGHYHCTGNLLTNLEGAPSEVNLFNCSYNKLTSLEGCPKIINDEFYCANNLLSNLKGLPSEIKGSFYCYYNKLTSLEGAPSTVGLAFNCSYNQLSTLKGSPSIVKGEFNCANNSIKLQKPDSMVCFRFIT